MSKTAVKKTTHNVINLAKQQLLQSLHPQTFSVGDSGSIIGMPRKFSTGSVGWLISGKAVVDGHPVQISGNVVIVKSKESGIDPADLKPIALTVGGGSLSALPRVFSTSSVGWYANGKALVQGHPVQIGINVVVAHSKDL